MCEPVCLSFWGAEFEPMLWESVYAAEAWLSAFAAIVVVFVNTIHISIM